MKQEPRKSATIVTTAGGGSSHSAICPYCSKLRNLTQELLSMYVFCTCGETFNLQYPEDEQDEQDEQQADEQQADEQTEENTPFTAPPATPRFSGEDRERDDVHRGPRNWPVH